jgi:hypothetical protein
LCNEKVQTTFISRLYASFDPSGDDLIRALVDDINSSYLYNVLHVRFFDVILLVSCIKHPKIMKR